MAFDWTPYSVGGATRPDSFSGMTSPFQSALMQLFEMAPDNIRGQLRVYSGYRSPERQAQLWQGALKKYGSPEAARKWVAPPGRSQHGHGNAADLRFLSPDAREWVRANAGKVGLTFPLPNEPWHVELAGARGGTAPQVPPQPQPQPQPQLQPTDRPPSLLAGIGSPNTPVAQPPQQMIADAPFPPAPAAPPQGAVDTTKLAGISGLLSMLSNDREQQPMQIPQPEVHRPQYAGIPQPLSLLAPKRRWAV